MPQTLQQTAVPSTAVLAATLRSAGTLPAGQMLSAASPYITAAPLMRKMTSSSIPTTLAASVTTAQQKQLYGANGEDLMQLEAAAVAAVNQNNNNTDDG